ncbi:LamB/YcsF family protein, partial [Bradyrhizobium sp. NBAIM08]|nr:LamB/YcsF family protein [Bradyrhizobium sp. NBAIM08]
SYRDLAGFGRRYVDADEAELAGDVLYQIGALAGICQALGARIGYVKPHGALYNRVARDEDQAAAVLDGSGELPVMGMPGSVLLSMAHARGRASRLEGFPDRGYGADGRLLPRDQPGALVTDPARVAS